MRTIRYLGPSAAVTGVYGRVTRGGTVEVEESMAKQLVSTGKWEYADSGASRVYQPPVSIPESSPTSDSDDDDTDDFPSVDSDDNWADD